MSHRSWITCVVATLSLVLLPPALARADTFNLDVGVVGNGVVAGHGYNCGVGVQTPVCSQAGWVTGNKLTLAAAPGVAPGWRFDHWSFSGNFTVCADGNVSSTTVNPCTFDMPATCICNRFVSITAVFVRSGQPTTSLSGGPAQGATVGPGGHSFSFSAEAGATFACRAWRTTEVAPAMGTCSSSWPITAATDGPWRFDVQAIDTYGNTGPITSRTWTVDATAPATNLDSHPALETIGTQARYDFSSPDGNATFQCQLDAADWAACSSPRILALGEGPHTFSVRAVDQYGNTDDTPQTWLWEQEIPPLTTFDEGPLDGALSKSAAPRFSFHANEPLQGFECKLDSGAWGPCTSPRDLSGLTDGAHTFSVRASDVRGNLELAPPSRTWTVDTAAPQTVISAGPAEGSKTSDSTARFGFTSEPGASFECAFGNDAFAPCPLGPDGHVSLEGLSTGEQRFRVRAVDQAGNTDFTPAERRWIVIADGDGDGFDRDKDCRDDNAAVNPSATDVPDNGRDENCDGADAIDFDRDGDGAKRPLDCDDADASRRPGAPEIPANGLDEDCNGSDADYKVVSAGITYQWSFKGAKSWPKILTITKVVAGSTVTVNCRSKRKGCPFKTKSLAGTGADLDLKRLFKGSKLKRGARVIIRVTTQGMMAKIVSFKVRKRKPPRGGRFRCRRPGASFTIACPAGA